MVEETRLRIVVPAGIFHRHRGLWCFFLSIFFLLWCWFDSVKFESRVGVGVGKQVLRVSHSRGEIEFDLVHPKKGRAASKFRYYFKRESLDSNSPTCRLFPRAIYFRANRFENNQYFQSQVKLRISHWALVLFCSFLMVWFMGLRWWSRRKKKRS